MQIIGGRLRRPSTVTLATTTAQNFIIGTCGYSYPGPPPNGWSGVFYPDKGKRVDHLEFYAAYFNALEINSTFYRPASSAMARRWLQRTPEGFIFTAKAWQKFTHPTQIGGENSSGERWRPFDSADVTRFRDGIAPLVEAKRLGALLFQYPASFAFDSANVERLEAALEPFDCCAKVVELRHRSWSEHKDQTDKLLKRVHASLAFIDEPKFASSIRQELTDSVAQELHYLRLHGRNQEKWWRHENAWERYDYFYPAENIRRLAERLKGMSQQAPGKKFYVFLNNHARGQAVANGLMLQLALHPAAKLNAPQCLLGAFPALAKFTRD